MIEDLQTAPVRLARPMPPTPDTPCDEAEDGEPRPSSGPAESSYPYGGGSFLLKPDGLYYAKPSTADDPPPPVWVCARLDIKAKTRDGRGNDWGVLLEWLDSDGLSHRWAMPLELLEGDGLEVRRELARQGLSIAPSRLGRDLLGAYLKVWPTTHRARCVDRLGWNAEVYATPCETIGESDNLVVFQSAHAVEPAWSVAGSAAAWRESVAALAAGNSRLVFAISAAFGGALLSLAGEDSGGFHLRGRSSTGKSTALRAAASVWGDPAAYARNWRSTANGLEGLAALHNDGLLILDELSQCDPRDVGEAAYLLANGQGKTRASRTGAPRAPQRWRLLFLSAGEESLTAAMGKAGKQSNVGQEVRLADIDADAGAGMGMFEDIHGLASPVAMAEAVKSASAKHHGSVGMDWLRHLVAQRGQVTGRLSAGIEAFVAATVPPGASGQVARVARRFGLVAMAGEIASEAQLTGWRSGESTHAAKTCFASWLEGFGSDANREEFHLLNRVRAFFEVHGASRFEDLSSTQEPRIPNRAGFMRVAAGGSREYLVFSDTFKSEICAGLDSRAAEQTLVRLKWIQPGRDRITQKPRLPGYGTSMRVYVFTAAVWEAEG